MTHNTKLELEIKNLISTLTNDEVYSEYGIIINADKTVFDDVNHRTYPNITDWVYDYVNDTGSEFEKFPTSYGYDDDY
jgi:hypothetical protein